jgi:hypothetical protein
MFGKKFQLANEDGNFPTEEDRGIQAQDDTVFIIYFKEKIVIYFKVIQTIINRMKATNLYRPIKISNILTS